jgi:hypothetical protein
MPGALQRAVGIQAAIVPLLDIGTGSGIGGRWADFEKPQIFIRRCAAAAAAARLRGPG